MCGARPGATARGNTGVVLDGQAQSMHRNHPASLTRPNCDDCMALARTSQTRDTLVTNVSWRHMTPISNTLRFEARSMPAAFRSATSPDAWQSFAVVPQARAGARTTQSNFLMAAQKASPPAPCPRELIAEVEPVAIRLRARTCQVRDDFGPGCVAGGSPDWAGGGLQK